MCMGVYSTTPPFRYPPVFVCIFVCKCESMYACLCVVLFVVLMFLFPVDSRIGEDIKEAKNALCAREWFCLLDLFVVLMLCFSS